MTPEEYAQKIVDTVDLKHTSSDVVVQIIASTIRIALQETTIAYPVRSTFRGSYADYSKAVIERLYQHHGKNKENSKDPSSLHN